jgi:hypothetical protein
MDEHWQSVIIQLTAPAEQTSDIKDQLIVKYQYDYHQGCNDFVLADLDGFWYNMGYGQIWMNKWTPQRLHNYYSNTHLGDVPV